MAATKKADDGKGRGARPSERRVSLTDVDRMLSDLRASAPPRRSSAPAPAARRPSTKPPPAPAREPPSARRSRPPSVEPIPLADDASAESPYDGAFVVTEGPLYAMTPETQTPSSTVEPIPVAEDVPEDRPRRRSVPPALGRAGARPAPGSQEDDAPPARKPRASAAIAIRQALERIAGARRKGTSPDAPRDPRTANWIDRMCEPEAGEQADKFPPDAAERPADADAPSRRPSRRPR